MFAGRVVCENRPLNVLSVRSVRRASVFHREGVAIRDPVPGRMKAVRRPGGRTEPGVVVVLLRVHRGPRQAAGVSNPFWSDVIGRNHGAGLLTRDGFSRVAAVKRIPTKPTQTVRGFSLLGQ